jgi:hypothetical protein
MAVTPERKIFRWGMAVSFNRYKFTTVSILKPPFGGFRSETVTWIQKYLKNKSVGASKKPYIK